jgi:hypothetical protein
VTAGLLETSTRGRRLEVVRVAVARTPAGDTRRRAMLALVHEALRREATPVGADDPDPEVAAPRFQTVSWPSRDHARAYRDLVDRIRARVDVALPVGARIAVVSRGDGELLRLGPRATEHFPQAPDGGYAGHHPRNDDAALALVERQRRLGAEYLLVPATAFWWLEHYAALAEALEPGLVCTDADCAIFDLRAT